ncbi:MAG: hypothetical protein OEY56_00750 [Cyclobacteriaceae bacterium]|nr:hypothetical protein [Cyclobacteriaceae bacterium]
MKNFNLALATLIAATVFSGCTLSKMIKLAADQELTVNPNPLELHGGNVPHTVSAVLPPKMLPTGKVYTIKTFYQYGDKEIEVGEIEFKADDFPNSSSTTSRKSAEFSFPYSSDMSPGKLMVQGIAKDPRNGKEATSAKLEKAVGIISTSSAVKSIFVSAYADHGYNDKEELEPTNINFYFQQGSSVLSPSISTDGTSNSAKQKNLAAFIAEKNVTRTVSITGTHSPEGSERINGDLSKDRADRIEKYYRQQMNRYNYKGIADSIKFIIKPVVEDWNAFRNALKTYEGISDDDKQAYFRVLDGSGSFEDKEKSLQKLASYKKVFNDIYPGLRTAKTEILTVIVKKSPASISVLAKQIVDGQVKEDTLSMAEFLYAAAKTPSLSEKAAIYSAATKRDGNWVAHNNLAATYLDMARTDADNRQKLIQDALTQLEIAAKKKDAPEVNANFATAYLMQGEKDKAYDALTKAEAGASNDLKSDINAMKGVVEIKNGKYDQAKASFASARNSDITNFNRGLANLLTDDYMGARNAFQSGIGGSIDADCYYYMAVAAARSKNATEVIQNLKEAISRDASLKEKAMNDFEFVNFADALAQAVR